MTETNKSEVKKNIKTEFKPHEKHDPFMLAYQNFRKNLAADGGLSESEWKEYFDIPRSPSTLRQQ